MYYSVESNDLCIHIFVFSVWISWSSSRAYFDQNMWCFSSRDCNYMSKSCYYCYIICIIHKAIYITVRTYFNKFQKYKHTYLLLDYYLLISRVLFLVLRYVWAGLLIVLGIYLNVFGKTNHLNVKVLYKNLSKTFGNLKKRKRSPMIV